jgi:hypothetical protein
MAVNAESLCLHRKTILKDGIGKGVVERARHPVAALLFMTPFAIFIREIGGGRVISTAGMRCGIRFNIQRRNPLSGDGDGGTRKSGNELPIGIKMPEQ